MFKFFDVSYKIQWERAEQSLTLSEKLRCQKGREARWVLGGGEGMRSSQINPSSMIILPTVCP